MPPILILLGLGAVAWWTFSEERKNPAAATPQTAADGNSEPPRAELDTARREIPVWRVSPKVETLEEEAADVAPDREIPAPQPITLEILREIFQDGARPLRRRDAVAILTAAPYYIPKTNAYRALAPARRFAAHLREDEQGWLRFAPP
jgi:hypothetical protein